MPDDVLATAGMPDGADCLASDLFDCSEHSVGITPAAAGRML